MAENQEQKKGLYVRNTTIVAALGGAVIGAILCGAVIIGIMPSKMIITAESAMGFDETVEALQKAVVDANWVVSGVLDVNKSMANKGIEFERRVKIVQLCSPKHAKSVLTSSMQMSAMMPCTVSVWTDEEDRVHVSRVNTSFMAALLGGEAGQVMGGEVAPAEEKILAGIVKDLR